MRSRPAETKAQHEDRVLVERAEALISTHLAEPLTIASIAAELYVGRSKLCEAFRRVRGKGVAELLRQERMNAALRLIASGEANIADAARAVGYARSSSFDEAFRREFGCSPTEWRKNREPR